MTGGNMPEASSPFWARHLRREVQFLLDLAALVAAFSLSYLFRFDLNIPANYLTRAVVQFPAVVLLQFLVLHLAGIYTFVWRYVGLAEIFPFVRGAVYSATLLLLSSLGLPDSLDQWRIPISIILMDTILAFSGVIGLRVVRRLLYERYERNRRQTQTETTTRKRVLLVGAGRAGVMAVREVIGRGDMYLDLVGFVDDDPTKLGTVIQGVKVLGSIGELTELAQAHEIDRVIITIAETNAETIRGIVETCERLGTEVRIIPGLYEILQGKVSISRFRAIQIEDLLGRETVQLDEEIVRSFVTGNSILVTGAGGSIGSELCRQIARFSPASLILVERAEGALFEVDRELRGLWPTLELIPRIADVGDSKRMADILGQHRPRAILHAAAHKHVPLMEENPGEAVKNNVLASRTLGQLAAENEVEAFVLISTDKAVRPSSMMGASKRLAELVVQDLDGRYEATRFLAVRFGNVMGSTGSVVQIFRRQIQHGGPVTVTHPEMTLFFMTISEAAQLVLEASALGEGGEILILDMGQPMKILDLAKDMITLSGQRPFEDIPITFTGLRPGEKMEEELELSNERVDRTRHPKIFIGNLKPLPHESLARAISRLEELVLLGGEGQLRTYIDDLLEEANLDRRATPRTGETSSEPADSRRAN